MDIKGALYAFLRTWNDMNAARKGRVWQRIGWRIAGALTTRLFNRVFR